NIQSMGATPILCSVIGADKDGNELKRLLEDKNLTSAGLVSSEERITTIKHRVISSGQHVLRIDSEMEDNLSLDLNHQLIERYVQLLPQADVVIFEDYDKGVLNPGNIKELIRLAQEQGIPTIVDPKKKNFLCYKGVTLFKPNLKELREGLKVEVEVEETQEFEAAVQLLRDKLQADAILVTLSEHGVFCLSDSIKSYLPAHLRSIADVSGAGDTVVSIAALCLALDTDLRLLSALANMGGGLVCEQVGVVPIDKDLLYKEALEEDLLKVLSA
ncbi:MAG: D-glycero-beta-D-manno-heptose-7-phosphate kinase, partial [Moraxellaceae bacterium]